VPPGVYTVRLTAAGKSYTQPVTVVNDPRSPATVADVRHSTACRPKIVAAMQLNLGRLRASRGDARPGRSGYGVGGCEGVRFDAGGRGRQSGAGRGRGGGFGGFGGPATGADVSSG